MFYSIKFYVSTGSKNSKITEKDLLFSSNIINNSNLLRVFIPFNVIDIKDKYGTI